MTACLPAPLGAVRLLSMAVLASCLMPATPCRADQIQLDNGDRLTGTIESVDAESVTLVTRWAGTLTVRRADIASIQTEAAHRVELARSTPVVGQFAVDDSGDQVLVVADEPRPLALAEVVAAAVPKPPQPFRTQWKNQVDFGAELSSGNNEQQKYALDSRSTVRQEFLRHELIVDLDLDRFGGVTNEELSQLDYSTDWFFAPGWFASGSLLWRTERLRTGSTAAGDTFSQTRTRYGVGIGRQFWDRPDSALRAELGVSAIQEEIEGVQFDNAALDWNLDYRRLIDLIGAEIFHRHGITWIADETRGTLFDSETGIRFALSDMWSANARVDIDLDTKPRANREKLDVVYKVGVGVRF